MLDLLVRDLSNGTPRVELERLGAPWFGWEWRSSAQGNMLRDRWVLVGTSVVFLQAVSLESRGADTLRKALVGTGWPWHARQHG
jgi:hypothetical protein